MSHVFFNGEVSFRACSEALACCTGIAHCQEQHTLRGNELNFVWKCGAVTCSHTYRCALCDLKPLWKGHIRVTPWFGIDSPGSKLTMGFPFQCVCYVHVVRRPSHVLDHPCTMSRQRGICTRSVFSIVAASFRTCRPTLWRFLKVCTSTARAYSMPAGLSLVTSSTQANCIGPAIPVSIHIGFPSGIIR